MICLGYDALRVTGDTIHARPNCAEPVGRFNASHLLPMGATPIVACAPTEALVRDGRPFVYPLELGWDWSRMLSEGPREFAPGIPDAVLDAIRAGRASLLALLVEAVPLQPHGDNPRWLFDHLQEFVTARDLPPERVWLASARVTGLGSFTAWLQERGLYEPEVFRFRALQPCATLVRALYQANAQGWDVVATYNDDFSTTVARVPFGADAFAARYVSEDEIARERRAGTLRPKRFLSMNRHRWSHRVYLASYLQARGWLDDCLISFAATPAEFYDLHPAPVLEDLLRAGWATLQPKLPLAIDEGAPVGTGFAADAMAKLKNGAPYRQSYFNITTETSVEPPAFHTEKIMKPILNLQPFLCVGPPHTLRYLRALGFKTYGRLIDESYDTAVDLPTRLGLLFQQIDRLAQLTPAQARDLYVEALPEMAHNRAHLIDGPHQLDRLFDELEAQLP